MDVNNVIIRKGIINTLQATGNNVLNVAAVDPNFAGECIVVADNTATPPVEILPPFPKDRVASVHYHSSQAEVVQKALIGRTVEVVVASTTYQIMIGNSLEKDETARKNLGRYTYVAPATLTGTAATDRSNMYTALNTKINADSKNHVTSHLVHSVAFTTGSVALPVIGEVFTQDTSGATFVLVGIDVTSGNFTATTAAGTLYLRSVTGTWDAASLVSTGVSTAEVTTNAALTQNQGLEIIDDANYYPPRPMLRRGISTILLTKGFATAQSEIGIATLAVGTTGVLAGINGVYSRGIGSRMLQDVPSYSPDKVFLNEGEGDFILNALPDAAKTYRTYVITLNAEPAEKLLTNYKKGDIQRFILYTDESNGGNLTYFNTALQTASGVTIVGA